MPLTLLQWSRPKGGRGHRIIGWCWVVLMALTAVSSFWIHQIRLLGPFSPIHLLSGVTLVALAGAIVARRSGRIASHRRAMMGITLGWVGAGLFALAPGRVMYRLVAS